MPPFSACWNWNRDDLENVQLKELEEKLVVVTRPASSPLPVEVACLAHLERYVEIAGSSIIVVAFYSRVSV